MGRGVLGKRLDGNMGALGAAFGASWALLERSWSGLGGLLGALGVVLEASWQVLEASGALLGRSWRHLARSWACLGRSRGALGGVLGALGALLEASWALQVAKMQPEGSPRRSKIDSQRRRALNTRILQKVFLNVFH